MEWEKIFTNYMTDKLIANIRKELIQFNIKRQPD